MAEPEKKTAPEPQNEPQKKEGVPEWVIKMQETLEDLPHRLAEAMKPSDPEQNDPEKPMEIPVPQPPEPEPQPEPTPADPEPEEKPKKRRFLDWLM